MMWEASYLGEKALVQARLATVSSRTNPRRLIDELLKLPLAEALIQELNGVAGYAKGKHIDSERTPPTEEGR